MNARDSKATQATALQTSSAACEHFVDGVLHVGLAGGVVRIDFAHLVSQDEGPDRLERNVRLVASLEGFVATYRTLQRMVEHLAAQGKIALASGPRVPDDAKRGT